MNIIHWLIFVHVCVCVWVCLMSGRSSFAFQTKLTCSIRFHSIFYLFSPFTVLIVVFVVVVARIFLRCARISFIGIPFLLLSFLILSPVSSVIVLIVSTKMNRHKKLLRPTRKNWLFGECVERYCPLLDLIATNNVFNAKYNNNDYNRTKWLFRIRSRVWRS